MSWAEWWLIWIPSNLNKSTVGNKIDDETESDWNLFVQQLTRYRCLRIRHEICAAFDEGLRLARFYR